METLSSSAAIVYSSSSSLSFFSPKRKDSPPRLLRLPTCSKENGNDSDLRSDSNDSSIVPRPLFTNPTLSNEDAMGLVLSAASVRGWTTGSGMEGPPVPAGSSEDGCSADKVSTFPWSLFTKSPRRRMRVAFTCNVCGQRTTRAINPHAYTEGTVFVQCCGCNVFHKLVDNLNLFHEMKCYVSPSFNYTNNAQMQSDVGFRLFDLCDEDDGVGDGSDAFPI